MLRDSISRALNCVYKPHARTPVGKLASWQFNLDRSMRAPFYRPTVLKDELVMNFFTNLERAATSRSSSMFKTELILKPQIVLELQWSELQLHNKWKTNNLISTYNNLNFFYTLSTIPLEDFFALGWRTSKKSYKHFKWYVIKYL